MRHQPGLKSDMLLAHLALNLGLGGERGNRINHYNVNRAGTDERFHDFQSLFPGVGLGD